MGMRIETEVILEDLSAGFDVLRAEAYVDEFRQIEQLRTDWDAGTIRFHRRRSSARVRLNGTLAGIGGLTVDPVVPNSSRVRRFHVIDLMLGCGTQGIAHLTL
jgi:hypothetical protein